MRAPAPAPPFPPVLGARELLVAFLAGPLLGALLAFQLGQDQSWDLLNYHYYNPFALLEQRWGFDVAPAMRQTWFSPYLDVPFYVLASEQGPLAASLTYGAFHGLLASLSYLLARWLLAGGGLGHKTQLWLAGGLALVAFAAPANLRELGILRNDNTTAVPLLAALLAVFARRPLLAGLLAGVAFGLKPTNGPYVLALLVMPAFARPRGSRWSDCGWVAFSGALGAAIAGGPWWWHVGSETGNPLFPQLNHLFESPYADRAPFTDDAYRGADLLATALYPFFHNALTYSGVVHYRFLDARLPLVLVLWVVVIAAWLWRRTAPATPVMRTAGALLLFSAIGYAGWALVFSIYRYALLLEVLAPLCCVAAFRLLRLRGRWLLGASVATCALIAATTHRDPAERAPWSDDLFAVVVPEPAQFRDSLVLIASDEPLAFTIPSFPRSARFVRIGGNLYYETEHPSLAARYDNALGDRIARLLRAHRGPLWLMAKPHEEDGARRLAEHFGVHTTGPPRFVTSDVASPIALWPAHQR